MFNLPTLTSEERAALESQNRGAFSLRLDRKMVERLWALRVLEQRLGGNVITPLGKKVLAQR